MAGSIHGGIFVIDRRLTETSGRDTALSKTQQEDDAQLTRGCRLNGFELYGAPKKVPCARLSLGREEGNPETRETRRHVHG
jgi:hypothetical protein